MDWTSRQNEMIKKLISSPETTPYDIILSEIDHHYANNTFSPYLVGMYILLDLRDRQLLKPNQLKDVGLKVTDTNILITYKQSYNKNRTTSTIIGYDYRRISHTILTSPLCKNNTLITCIDNIFGWLHNSKQYPHPGMLYLNDKDEKTALKEKLRQHGYETDGFSPHTTGSLTISYTTKDKKQRTFTYTSLVTPDINKLDQCIINLASSQIPINISNMSDLQEITNHIYTIGQLISNNYELYLIERKEYLEHKREDYLTEINHFIDMEKELYKLTKQYEPLIEKYRVMLSMNKVI